MAWLSRNKLLPFLFLAVFFNNNPAGAEILTGTVVSVEDKHFIVRTTLQQEKKTTEREFRVVFVPARNKPHFLGQPYPYCVRIGTPIRLKGRWNTKNNTFLAVEIRRCPNRGKHHYDPTGVRARLGRCRNPQAEP